VNLLNTRSISGKLTRIHLLVSGTALVLAFVAYLGLDLYSFRENLIHSLTTEAGIVGTNSVTALLFDDQESAKKTLEALRNSPQILGAVITRPDGMEFARYARDRSSQVEIRSKLLTNQTSGHWNQGTQMLLGSRIIFQGKPVGTVYLLAETRDLLHRAAQYGLVSSCILIISLGFALLATSSVRRFVTDPLTGLAETAQIISRDNNYSARAKQPINNDELSFLVQSFNGMLDQIEDRDRALNDSRNALEKRVAERTAELTEANKELEAFSYSVAHDLRGPLQMISNISFLLRQRNSTDLDPDTSELIEQLGHSSKRMSSLIDDLLNLARATSATLRREPIDLSEMVTSILRGLEKEEPDRRSRIIVVPGARVVADEGLICVALENILRNAWKYTSKVDMTVIEFGYAEEKSETVYFVRDNGAGFDPQYGDRLFRPFQRLHAQSEFPGTGVGLATAQRIIDRHGGKIWAEGSIGKGAVFYFTVPYIAQT
jgi:signal transduction histidine kinase